MTATPIVTDAIAIYDPSDHMYHCGDASGWTHADALRAAGFDVIADCASDPPVIGPSVDDPGGPGGPPPPEDDERTPPPPRAAGWLARAQWAQAQVRQWPCQQRRAA